MPLAPSTDPWTNRLALAYCGVVGLALALFLGTALFASLVKVWPYDLSLSLKPLPLRGHGRGRVSGPVEQPAPVPVLGPVAGTALCFFSGLPAGKDPRPRRTCAARPFLSMLPLALPGLVIGLAYIFFFNAPGWDPGGPLRLPNPLHPLYGTMAILVLSNVVHFYTVAFSRPPRRSSSWTGSSRPCPSPWPCPSTRPFCG